MPTDTERMDWLCQQVVEVRKPLVYGSHHTFFASPDEEAEYSDLRRKIDQWMSLPPKSLPEQKT